MRPRRVAAREDEAVAARRQRLDQVVQHGAQTGEALEGPQFEELVEQERGGRAAARPRGVEKRERGVERLARARLAGRRCCLGRKRRVVADGREESLRRGGNPLDVDVLARRAGRSDRAGAAAERCDPCRIRPERPGCGRVRPSSRRAPRARGARTRPLRNDHRVDPSCTSIGIGCRVPSVSTAPARPRRRKARRPADDRAIDGIRWRRGQRIDAPQSAHPFVTKDSNLRRYARVVKLKLRNFFA